MMQIGHVKQHNNCTFGNVRLSQTDRDAIQNEVNTTRQIFASVSIDTFINRHVEARRAEEKHAYENNLVHCGPKQTLGDITEKASEIYRYLLTKCDKYSKNAVIDYVTDRHEQFFNEDVESRKAQISKLEQQLKALKLELETRLINKSQLIRDAVFVTMKQKLSDLQDVYNSSQAPNI